VMYKTTLEYTAPVKPIVAQFTATDGIGIAPKVQEMQQVRFMLNTSW
jgi:hypothetical protein